MALRSDVTYVAAMVSDANALSTISSRQSAAPLLATVLYEDLEAGLRARGLMECMGNSMDFPLQFNLGLWRLDWLAEGALGNVALGRANRSDLLLISISSTNPWPEAALEWIESWVKSSSRHPLALVLLLPREHRELNGEHPLLRQSRLAAERKKVAFFCEFFERAARSDGNAASGDNFSSSSGLSTYPTANSRKIARLLNARTIEQPGGVAIASTQVAAVETTRSRAKKISASVWGSESGRPVPIRRGVVRSTEEARVISKSHGSTRQRAVMHSTTEPSNEACQLEFFQGVTMADLNASLRRQVGLTTTVPARFVTGIDTNSPAFRAGLRAGDVIAEVERREAATLNDASLRRAAANAILFRVWNREGSRVLVLNERRTR